MKLKEESINKVLHELKTLPSVKVIEKDCSYTRTIFNRNAFGWLFDEIESFLPTGLGLRDEFRGCRYDPGDFMNEHRDGDYAYAELSGGIELNRDYKGGEFIIDSKPLQSEVGELFTFGRFIKHRINKLTDGTRYSLHFHIINLKQPYPLI